MPLLAATLALITPAFSSVDAVIVIVYLLGSVALGLLANRVVSGIGGYLVAGRTLGTALAIATMTGSELGLITVMYQAQKGFTGGFAALHIGVIAGLVTLVVGLTGFIVAPLREAGVMTIPEYYERRFGRRTRILGGVLLALGGILNMGLFLRVGSQFVVGVTGLDPHGATLPLIMLGLLTLVLIYTVLGGMVSVVLTDYAQFVVLSIGLVLMVVLSARALGADHLVAVVAERRGLAGFDPRIADAGFGPGYIAWMAVLGLVSAAIWPTAVTRALASKSVAVVKRQYALASLSFMIRFLIPCFMGVCAFVFLTEAPGVVLYAQGPGGPAPAEPGALATHFALTPGGPLRENLEAFPILLANLLPVGLLGVVTAAMLAAFMSTHDSYLLCWASVLTRDVVDPLLRARGRPLDERAQIKLTRVFIVLIGLWVLLWGVFYSPSQDVWDYIGITGAVYFTGAIAVLSAGLYWRRASSTGAVLALLAGFSAVAGLGPVQRLLGLNAPSWLIGLGTLALAFAAMLLGSLLAPDRPRAPLDAEARP
ncbi:MAG: sodium:solute symporter family protein [Myxococcales bacterium]|nr:sodium:solute symporter family protein [Myxococcales bacterium]